MLLRNDRGFMPLVFSSALLTSRRSFGAHHAPSAQHTVETLSKSNVVSGRDFAKLDQLLREKPNSTTLPLRQ